MFHVPFWRQMSLLHYKRSNKSIVHNTASHVQWVFSYCLTTSFNFQDQYSTPLTELPQCSCCNTHPSCLSQEAVSIRNIPLRLERAQIGGVVSFFPVDPSLPSWLHRPKKNLTWCYSFLRSLGPFLRTFRRVVHANETNRETDIVHSRSFGVWSLVSRWSLSTQLLLFRGGSYDQRRQLRLYWKNTPSGLH